jgi:hypothetical protein
VVDHAHDVAARSRAAAVSTFLNKVRRRQGAIGIRFQVQDIATAGVMNFSFFETTTAPCRAIRRFSACQVLQFVQGISFFYFLSLGHGINLR